MKYFDFGTLKYVQYKQHIFNTNNSNATAHLQHLDHIVKSGRYGIDVTLFEPQSCVNVCIIIEQYSSNVII